MNHNAKRAISLTQVIEEQARVMLTASRLNAEQTEQLVFALSILANRFEHVASNSDTTTEHNKD